MKPSASYFPTAKLLSSVVEKKYICALIIPTASYFHRRPTAELLSSAVKKKNHTGGLSLLLSSSKKHKQHQSCSTRKQLASSSKKHKQHHSCSKRKQLALINCNFLVAVQ